MTSQDNVWERAIIDPERLARNQFLHPELRQGQDSVIPETGIITGPYIPIPSLEGRYDTYITGIHELRRICSEDPDDDQPTITIDGTEIPRPLTLEETIRARVQEYETIKDQEERLRLLNTWFFTCTGIAYQTIKRNNNQITRIKIIPECEQLISIEEDFNEEYLPTDFSSLTGTTIEIDDNYNRLLTAQEVLNHEGWKALVTDTELLRTYTQILTAEGKTQMMRFYLTTDKTPNQLRALAVYILDGYSNALGDCNLNDYARFLWVAQAP